MLKNYFVIALRNLTRNKVYAFINIAGLSLGLACAMLIILYTKDEVSFDRFHANVDNIYRITSKRIKPDGSVGQMGGYTGYFPGPKFAAAIPEVKGFVRYQGGNLDVKQGTEIKSQDVFYADTSFFNVFSFPLISGNPLTALQKPNSVVITEDIAMKYFGTTRALGKTIQFKKEDKFEPYEITGIAKKSPQNSSIKFDVLVPFVVSAGDEANNENWLNFFLNTFIVLNPGADLAKVEQKMKRVYESDAKESIKMAAEKYGDKDVTVYNLQPFIGMHLSKDYKADNGLVDASNPMYSYILSGIALFILLIACINFINLTIARSLKRAKEIGVRKVVGGDRKQLALQFLGESFLLCTAAFLLAMLIVRLILPAFNEVTNKSLAFSYLFDVKLVTGYVVLFFITGLLAGFYPALILSNFNPVQTLYNRFNLSGKNYLQKGLVVLQFTLATILIVVTGTIYLQFNYLTNTDLGYDDNNTVVINKWGITRDEAKLFKESLLKEPGISAVAPKNGGSWGTVAQINGETKIEFAYETVDESYLPLYKIPIIAGRNFSPDFPADSTKSILINETFAKKAGWKNPVGEQVDFWYNNEKFTVVGVVKDHHFEALSNEIKPQLFTMKPGNQYGMFAIKVKPGTETKSLAYIKTVFKKIFPISPYDYRFKDQENLKHYEAEAKWKQVMMMGAILTIFISCIGLFGLSVLSAEKRTKEIGIRKVLGASVASVVNILSLDFLKLVAISLLIAMPVAWLTTSKWLQNYPYRISLSWWLFVSAALLVLLVALATVSFQAIKAAVANPVKSLRSE
jgi:putative ABC transport system permease protein